MADLDLDTVPHHDDAYLDRRAERELATFNCRMASTKCMVIKLKGKYDIDIVGFCVKKAGRAQMHVYPSDVISTIWSFYGGKMFPDVGDFWNACHVSKLDELEAIFPHPTHDARVAQALCCVMGMAWQQYCNLYFHHFPS